MTLNFKVAKLDEVPAEARGFYVEKDGAFVLDVAGVADKARLDEFRANNITLANELKALQQRFAGINPDEVRQLAAEKQRLEEERQLKAGELDKVVESRIKGLKAEWEQQVTSLTTERDALNTRLVKVQIDQGVITAATKRGLRPSAIPDITARARQVCRLVQGVPQVVEADGQTVRYGRDGVSPMTLEEWVDTQVSDAPHLFESNAGSGGGGATSPYRNGSGGAGGNGTPVRNPFRKGPEWNLTEQMRLLKSDPGLAARLQAAA